MWALLTNLLLALGTLKLFSLLYDLFKVLNRTIRPHDRDHLERYGGKGTWALVTGADNEIGLEMCKKLASDGFNICLVSDNRQKLQNIINQ